jgi:hypothetical protein
LVQGAFLSDEWADTLVRRIVTGRASDDRALLPTMLRRWGIDITERVLPDGRPLWQTLHSTVWPDRNRFVHEASQLSEKSALTALQCASAVLQVVLDMAAKLGFALATTGKWSVVSDDHGTRYREPESPF